MSEGSSTPDRAIRVFVSSTFHDMHAEREVLVKQVFPQLRKLCEQHGAAFTEIDLRWGVTAAQAERGDALSMCLGQIDTCRPYFIGLIGDRYGTQVDVIPQDIVSQFPWLAGQEGKSYTELEILYGALAKPELAGRAFFYLRSAHDGPSALSEPAAAGDRKLESLKARIRASGLPVREVYADPQQLGRWVLEDFTKVIEGDVSSAPPVSPLDRQNALHDAFARRRAKHYIEQPRLTNEVDAHVDDAGAPLAILGEAGVGKSTLLANWLGRRRARRPDELIVAHFSGATSDSSSLASLLRRVLGELRRRYDIKGEIPADPRELKATFFAWLQMASARGRTILVFDALNQLDDRDGALELTWLPDVLPDNVRLIVSTTGGPTLSEITSRRWRTLTVEPLEAEGRRRLIKQYLASYGKSLSDAHVDQIALGEQTSNPLFLQTLLNELRQFGSYEELNEQIEHYLSAGDIGALYHMILHRWEQEYDPERRNIVRDTLSLLWASRKGLSETELLELLNGPANPYPRAQWLPLFLAAEDALIDRDGLSSYANQSLRTVVEQRYIADAQSQRTVRQRLSAYFSNMSVNYRVFDELPWQLARSEDWRALRGRLIDGAFIEELFARHEYHELVQDALAGLGLDAGELLKEVVEHPARYSASALGAVHGMLLIAGAFQAAQQLSSNIIGDHAADRGGALYANALMWQTQTRSIQGDYDYEDLIDQAEPVFRALDDEPNIAYCLQRRADVAKFLRKDFRAGIEFHRAQDAILRRIGDVERLINCLNNQATSLGRLNEFEKQLELRFEAQRLAREVGNPSLMSLAEHNLGMTHLNVARLQRMLRDNPMAAASDGNVRFIQGFRTPLENMREGWRCLIKALSRGPSVTPQSRARILRHQVEVISSLADDCPMPVDVDEIVSVVAQVGIPKAIEAENLYAKYGDARMSERRHLHGALSSMNNWLELAETAGPLGALLGGDVMSRMGAEEGSAENLPENRAFARFILSQEEEAGGVKIMPKTKVKRVGGGESWEIENCPPNAYRELDRRGLIPPAGRVSRPGNVWLAKGKEPEVVACLTALGVDFESDLP